MKDGRFALGLDFGTKSIRALLLDVRTGREAGTAVSPYAHGVIDEHLPGTTIRLDPDWALQDANDYVESLKQVIPKVLKQSDVPADLVVGLGVDFTSATIIPTREDGTPLCTLSEWKARPHAWVKLWKHHAAQTEADRINELADSNVSGMLLGATLGTRAPDIYRALIEATAFGTQMIIETFEANGVPVNEIVACGGLAERNALLMQIYADVTGRTIRHSASSQTSALGAAVLAAVASGVYDSMATATKQMTRLPRIIYQPNTNHHATYERLFAEYRRLHDYFGCGENQVMKNLRRIRTDARVQRSDRHD